MLSQPPTVSEKLGLGVGIDMPWSRRGLGFRPHSEVSDCIPSELIRFFDLYRHNFNYTFLAFQPKGRRILQTSDYFPAYDQFFAISEGDRPRVRAFHHTLLNLGAVEFYNRSPIIEFTNQLIARYQFQWVVEDLGIWSIRGKSLPYPLPPLLTREGLASCISHIKAYQHDLDAPLCVEFPGFSDGHSFVIGDLDAFDFFAAAAYETGCPVTIDVGHILSYQWLRGKTGDCQFEGLERLPLDHCFELHLSGCSIVNGKFRDLHNGILMDEQIEVLEYLFDCCANLKAVTYEDPRFTHEGELVPRARHNFLRLKTAVQRWAKTS